MESTIKLDPYRAKWGPDLMPVNLTAFLMDLIQHPACLRKIDWTKREMDWTL